jgi:hypothetical protein
MNKLQILGREGHRELTWDAEQVVVGETEATDVIAEAERIVAEALERGHLAVRIDAPDQPAQRIEKFDYTAPRTVIVPRMVGGA